jgi:hypothetical protein
MGLQPKTTELSIVDQNLWQKSDLGQHSCPTITLDLTKFETNPAGGFVPDGFAVVKDEDTDLYVPAIVWDASLTPDAYAQADEAAGHVYKPVAYDAGQTRVAAALFWIGRVAKAHVPVPTGHPGAAFDASKGAKGIVYV